MSPSCLRRWFAADGVGERVLRLCGVDPNAEEENVSEEEIRMMVDAGGEKGTIDREEPGLYPECI